MLKILHLLEKNIPEAKTELVYNTPFELLVSVMLSAQATDVSVNKATKELFKIANTPKDVLKLGEAKLRSHIKSIGLYNSKAKNLIKTCEMLTTEYSSTIPNNRESLQNLPGIGRKSANVILNVIFNAPEIGVDTHIFRVCNRTKIAVGKTPEEVEKLLIASIPESKRNIAHHLLVLHGRYTCTAKKPKCNTCIIQDLCKYCCKK